MEQADIRSRWLNPKQAALYVGHKAPTAYKQMNLLARAGKIKAGHDGRTWTFLPENLDDWLIRNARKIVR
jgi:helix-turn-helix protein